MRRTQNIGQGDATAVIACSALLRVLHVCSSSCIAYNEAYRSPTRTSRSNTHENAVRCEQKVGGGSSPAFCDYLLIVMSLGLVIAISHTSRRKRRTGIKVRKHRKRGLGPLFRKLQWLEKSVPSSSFRRLPSCIYAWSDRCAPASRNKIAYNEMENGDWLEHAHQYGRLHTRHKWEIYTRSSAVMKFTTLLTHVR